MKQYRCKETIYLEKVDDKGFLLDEPLTIPEGSIWQEDPSKQRDSDGVILDQISQDISLSIEITRDTLEEYFLDGVILG